MPFGETCPVTGALDVDPPVLPLEVFALEVFALVAFVLGGFETCPPPAGLDDIDPTWTPLDILVEDTPAPPPLGTTSAAG